MKKIFLCLALLLGLTGVACAAQGDTFKITLSTTAAEVGFPGRVTWMYAVSHSTWAQNIKVYDGSTEKFNIWMTTGAETVPIQTEISPKSMKFKTSIKASYDTYVATATCPVYLYLGIE